MKAENYGISIRKGVFSEEECYEARVREFPDLIEYADSWNEAYELAIDAIETTLEVFAEKGRNAPAPQTEVDDYSGRVTLRIPKTLHAVLSYRAVSEGVSLNQYMVSILSAFRGFDVALEEGAKEWSDIKFPNPSKKAKSTRVLRISDYQAGKLAVGY